jgi:two-component system, cell cycle response regulator
VPIHSRRGWIARFERSTRHEIAIVDGATSVSLRARLTLFFVGIVVVPLLAAVLVLESLVGQEVVRRTNTRLEGASRAVSAIWGERLQRASTVVRVSAQRLADRPRADIRSLRRGAGLDFLIVSRAEGPVIASSTSLPEVRGGTRLLTPETLAGETVDAPVIRAQVPLVRDGERRVLTGGWYADRALARHLREATGLQVAIIDRDRVAAATAGDLPAPRPGASGTFNLGEDRRAVIVPAGSEGSGILLVADEEGGVGPLPLIAVALIGLVLATLLAAALARLIAFPLQRLAEGARRVASGDFETRVPTGGSTETARVAESFNTMTGALQTYIAELERSRDELRHNLERFGATLRATLDLGGMLEAVLETAMMALRAEAGAVFLLHPSGRQLSLRAVRGYAPPQDGSLPVGRGIAGHAARGERVLLPGEARVASSGPMEPATATAVAVPLERGLRVIGVIALYGRPVPEPFREEDAESLASFAAQASVAIENVLLHQETERLSITDGLTGVWNRRYLELTLRKEIDRAQRFDRPLSLLMIDIDHFKRVNDLCGHQRGDEVLVELTRRVLDSVRTQIDTLARYGGEEFVVVLPETPEEGARVVAEKIRGAVRDHSFASDTGPDVSTTVSVGVASFPEDGKTAQELLHAADLAMYRAKQGGRDRVEASDAG